MINYDEMNFISWLDVDRALKTWLARSDESVQSSFKVETFYNGADIYYRGEKQAAKDIILKEFENDIVIENDELNFILKTGNTRYPLSLIKGYDDEFENKKVSYPLWKDNLYRSINDRKYPKMWNSGPDVVAFHSFKGGVGRTTSMMTYVSAYLKANDKKDVKLLLIDADLEAPGISFWLPDANRPTVSFIKFLEALQYPSKSTDEVIEYFYSELRKTSIDVGGARRQVFVLPASLHVNEILDMSVTPGHISRDHRNPWKLTDHIHELGKHLEVDMIFVDLRAGLSELASPLLFDPRVEHFFVTTVAPQSTNGMKYILENVYNFQKNINAEEYPNSKPSLIFSLLTPHLKKLDYPTAIEVLSGAYPSENVDDLSSGIEIIDADFNESLMSMSSIRDSLVSLEKSSFFDKALEWAASRSNSRESDNTRVVSNKEDKIEQVKRLYNTCNSFQFAEQAAADDMLVTEPIRNFAKHFSSELPNVVSVGAKGAGKTFTYLQVCRTQTWKKFLEKLEQDVQLKHDGFILPILASDNISSMIVQQTYAHTLDAIGQKNKQGALSSNIKTALRDNDTDWDEFWEKQFCLALDEQSVTFEDLNSTLLSLDTSVTIILDGIEDNFDTPEASENQREAIKSLLQIPNKLRSLSDRRIGFVCFVRADYVQSVIKQNVAQYMYRYEAFKLEWTPETFLRLAYWICGKAGVINANPDNADGLYIQELITELEALWGKKMGRNASKEANSARWVFAALCDLNGKLQARDLVRFLKFSAKGTMSDTSSSWSDRLLNPDAIRRSLNECGAEKIAEVVKEVSLLRLWAENLTSKPQDVKIIPFSSEEVGLDSVMLSTLKELGIIYEDVDRLGEINRFYLPEIYRLGLGFKASAGGRPRVQALLKRNIGGMPF
ncbi:KGGVGR-motif variant AAA ATPase [Aeromonas veronii]|uniref:KGGVGR-motif variant AAA ATPase n=1 Tax=Aeromonas veronii TaxID=654 RepID=UPI001F37AD8B|nr:hypothetical protein [Aeromonas veronii]MCF7744316.1 ParA family protein [Aeromonas veronii]